MDTIFYKIQKHSRLLKISVIAALLFAYCFLPLYACAAPDENIKTTSYNVNVNVNKDKTFDITEHITVDFSEGSIGIIREIPARVEAVFETRGGEVRQDVRLKIKVKSVSGGPYSLFESDEGVSIRTGDPEIYLSGRHEYVINYRIEPFEGDIGSDDGIFLDLIPQSWKYGIESARVIVTFPNDVDIKDFGFVGIEGGLVDTDLMSVERLWPDAVGAYTLDATSKRPLRHGEGVAFRAIAPYGFFQGGGSTQAGEAGFPVGGVRFPVSGALFWIAVAAAPFACLLLWFAYGMDERIEETTEYYPPDGLLPAEVGLLMDGRLQDRELLSMVFYWANQGCLKIEETGRQDLTLHKVCDLPAGAKQFEKSLFESIFADGDQASLKSSARQIGRGLLKAKHLLIADFGNNTIKNLYDKQSLDMRTVAFLISLLPVIFNFIYALDAGPFESVAGAGLPEAPKLSEVDNYGVTMVTPLGFFVLFIALCMIRYAGYAMVHSEEVAEKSNELAERAYRSLSRARRALSDSARLPKTVTGALLSPLLIAGVVVLLVCGIFILRTPGPAACTAGSTLVCIFLALITRKRTGYYNFMLGWIGGFAAFIKDADPERIDSLVDEDPGYIYDIIPYVVAMDLTDDWVRRFVWSKVKAQPPDWYCRSGPESGFFYGAVVKKLAGRLLIAEKEIERA